MIIIILRHGQSEADLLNVHEGRANFDLTDLGIKQVDRACKEIVSRFNIEKIFSSPLQRAVHTAKIFKEYKDCEIEYLDELMEFNNGLLAGMDKKEAAIVYPKKEDLPYDESMYEMESLKEFRLRSMIALDKIIKENKNILVVCHGGIINQLYQSFLNMEIPSYTQYITKDAGYHVWEIKENKRIIIESNK